MFNLHNSTDKFVVIFDNHFQFFENGQEARGVYNLIGDIDESIIGSAEFITPNYICEKCIHEGHEDCKDYYDKNEDLKKYLETERDILNNRVKASIETSNKEEDYSFFFADNK